MRKTLNGFPEAFPKFYQYGGNKSLVVNLNIDIEIYICV